MEKIQQRGVDGSGSFVMKISTIALKLTSPNDSLPTLLRFSHNSNKILCLIDTTTHQTVSMSKSYAHFCIQRICLLANRIYQAFLVVHHY